MKKSGRVGPKINSLIKKSRKKNATKIPIKSPANPLNSLQRSSSKWSKKDIEAVGSLDGFTALGGVGPITSLFPVTEGD